ncbi:Rieske 2Fe-2S domain-containing protein [Pseudarthrobacter sp. NamE5]|nr:Rieske 2Fe-2S domain-containing protein [Pseudarthrobacter sp. NamE5]
MRDNRRRLVVIGNGMAGARAVEEILARGGAKQFRITMFGDEPYGNYNRIMLSHVLSGDEDDDAIFLNPLSWYRDNGITLHAGVRAKRIDRFTKNVFSSDGRVTPYNTLIIATGSRSHMPPMKGLYTPGGSVKQGIFGFRTIDDTRKMLAYAQHEQHRHAVVIGGGLLGLEAASGLRRYGLEVDVVHSGGHLMSAQMGPDGGAVLRRSVQALGIGVYTGSRTTAVLGTDKVAAVRLRDRSDIECDMVVMAADIRPNVDLAVLSGLPVERAIVVDDSLRVQDEDDIYAVGECVQHRGQVYGLVAPLWEQAAVLANHVTGADTSAAYHGSRTATKLKVAGIEVASMGLQGPELETDEQIVFSEPSRGVFKSIVVRDNKMVGATLLGDSRKVAFLTQAFDRGLPLPEERLGLMFDLGTPGQEVGVAELDDDAQVCSTETGTKTHILGFLEQIPVGEGRAFAVDGKQVAVFRLRNHTLRAVSAVCPHRGGPLADGTIDGQVVMCPLHQHAFDLATGCSTTGAGALQSYRVRLDREQNLVLETVPV